MSREERNHSIPRETEKKIDLARWAQRVGEKYPLVNHIYLFGSKVHGRPNKDDTDIFLMVDATENEHSHSFIEQVYADPEISFPELDLFLTFTDGPPLLNWKTERMISEDATRFWQEGLDYRLLWNRSLDK